MIKLKKKKSGFTVVEILLAIAIFVSSGTAIVYLLVDAGRSNQQSIDRFFASTMAESGIEATRNIRDGDWNSLVDGNHGLAQVDGKWTFSGPSDSDASGRFSRQISISSISADEKLVTSTINWNSVFQKQSTVSFSTYLSNLSKATVMPPSWDNPRIIASIGTQVASGNRNPYGVFVLGNYAYLVTDRASSSSPELFVYDISNPAVPTLVGSCLTGKRVNSVFVAGNYAYLATQNSGNNRPEMVIARITDPANPTVVSRVTLTGNAFAKDLAVIGNRAYVTTLSNSNGSEFFVVDVTDPEHPGSVLGNLEFGSNLNAISVSGNYAYVATSHNSREIQVVDISTPASPRVVKTFDNPGNADGSDVLVSGNNLYLTTLSNGTNPNLALLTIDVSNPSNIVINNVGQMQVAESVNALALDATNNQLFLATSLPAGEIISVNIASPQSPTLKASVDLPNSAVALFYNGSNLFVANNTVDQQLIIIGQGQ